MSKIIQKPRECRNAHCGAMCCPIQAEEMQTMWGGNPNKCPMFERRDDLYMEKSIPLEKVKQAREEMNDLDYLINDAKYSDRETRVCNVDILVNEFYEIMNKLIAESEG